LLSAGFAVLLGAGAHANTVITLFAGGNAQRPDLLRKVLDRYQQAHPDISVELRTGGATSELQRKYLSTLLNARDTTFDGFLIDIVNPAQYAAAGWIEPLDRYLGADKDKLIRSWLPAYAEASLVDGKVVALPAFSDATFLYYRKDLLDKYKLAVPTSWDALGRDARQIQAGEGAAVPEGLSIQGAPIEGAVCTFLTPYWSQGKQLTDAAGHLTLDKPAAVRGLQMWRGLLASGVLKRNIAEVKTADTVNAFKAGRVAYAVNWGFAFGAFQNDADSQVKGKIGIAPLPAMAGGQSVGCIGGWQWSLSSFSQHKTETVAVLRYLSSPEVARTLAEDGALLPAFSQLYRDTALNAKLPWLQQALPVLERARARPVSARYGEVSDTIRVATSAALAGAQSPEQAVDEVDSRLRRVLR